MPTPRGGLGAALVGGKIYAVGGESVTSAFDTMEAYDIAGRSWSTGTPLGQGRHGLGVVALGQTFWRPAEVMQHMVAKPGSWVILYDAKVKELDARTARAGQGKPLDTSAPLLCVRVASGAHVLAKDRKGGLATGNCIPIT